eukprot:m.22171 g.22171  ORF g.22171 m.22171 type:complete len:310 (+) comp6707_c0_seq1:128-1057(+)
MVFYEPAVLATDKINERSPLLRNANWWSWVALLLMLLGLATPHWAVTVFSVPSRENPEMSRGLFLTSLTDGYGVRVDATSSWGNAGEKDENGYLVDPYCGDNDGLPFFAQTDIFLFLFRGIEVGPEWQVAFGLDDTANETSVLDARSKLFLDRNYDTNDWCTDKQTAAGFALAAVLVLFAACLTGFCVAHRSGTLAFTACCFLSSLFGTVAWGIIAHWVDQTSDTEADWIFRAFPLSEVDLDVTLSWSIAVFMGGTLVSFVAGILGVCHVYFLHGRAEELARDDFMQRQQQSTSGKMPVSGAVQDETML